MENLMYKQFRDIVIIGSNFNGSDLFAQNSTRANVRKALIAQTLTSQQCIKSASGSDDSMGYGIMLVLLDALREIDATRVVHQLTCTTQPSEIERNRRSEDEGAKRVQTYL